MLQWQGKDMVKVQQRQVSRNSDNWSKKREGNRGAKKAEITLTSQPKDGEGTTVKARDCFSTRPLQVPVRGVGWR
jgi:hypothetical protein